MTVSKKNTLAVSMLLAMTFTFLGCSSEDGKEGENIDIGESCVLSADKTILKCGEESVTLNNNADGSGLFCELETKDDKNILRCGEKQLEIEGSSGCKLTPNGSIYTLECAEMSVDITGEGMVVIPQQQQTLKKASVSGISQKGPFIKGSSITIMSLDEEYAQTGRNYESIITSDKGDFALNDIDLPSDNVVLKADGYYRNEVTGKNSASRITLFAIANVGRNEGETEQTEPSLINVNILTHLEYYMVLDLLREGKTLAEAKAEAQEIIFEQFNITSDSDENSEKMSIFNNSKLLAISVLLLSDLGDAAFSELLTDLNVDLKENGTWGNDKEKTRIADWAFANNTRLGSIRNNIKNWNLSETVPEFESYIRNYWYVNYKLNTCGTANAKEVKKNGNEASVNRNTHYICEDNAWRVATSLEYNTYGWDACVGTVVGSKPGNVDTDIFYECKSSVWIQVGQEANELYLDTYTYPCASDNIGEIKSGKVNTDMKYICNGSNWRIATQLEKDTYGKACSASENRGAVIPGIEEASSYYACNGLVWNPATSLETTVGSVCLELGETVVGKDGMYYTCSSGNAWQVANGYIMDTEGWNSCAGDTYEVKRGNVDNNKFYICRNSTWQVASGADKHCYFDKKCDYFTDSRDGTDYKYTTIGEQTWMAEDLSLEGKSEYTWEEAKNNACPAEWHLPSVSEWDELIAYVGGASVAGGKLKAISGWKESYNNYGTDDYGFSALPFDDEREKGFWWSSIEQGWNAYSYQMNHYGTNINKIDYSGKSEKYHIRCVKND